MLCFHFCGTLFTYNICITVTVHFRALKKLKMVTLEEEIQLGKRKIFCLMQKAN